MVGDIFLGVIFPHDFRVGHVVGDIFRRDCGPFTLTGKIMKISLRKLLNLVGIITISIFSFAAKKAEPVNGECPYSGKAVKADKVLTFNVCCNNCVKKASADLIATMFAIDIRDNQWPDLLGNLSKNTQHENLEIKKAAIMTLGEICDKLNSMDIKLPTNDAEQV